MKTNFRTKWIAISFLFLALCIGFWQFFRNSNHDMHDDFNQEPANLNHSDKIGNIQTAETLLVEVSGLGKLPYKNIEKLKDLNDLFFRCGLFSEGELELRKEKGRFSPVDVYTNEKGEIVHLSFQKGRYKTKSRDSEFISDLERDDMRGDPALKIVSYGIPGLTLEPSAALKNFIRKSNLSVVRANDGKSEIEVTPVMVEVMPNISSNPKYIGKRYPMILMKYSRGKPSSRDVVIYQDYLQKELIEREWIIEPILPDPDDPNGLAPKIASGGIYDEPLIEAWEAHEAKKIKEHPPLRK